MKWLVEACTLQTYIFYFWSFFWIQIEIEWRCLLFLFQKVITQFNDASSLQQDEQELLVKYLSL